MSKKHCTFIKVLLATAILNGCAMYGNHVRSIPSNMVASPPSTETTTSKPITITLRWPVAIDESATSAVAENWAIHHANTFNLQPEIEFASGALNAANNYYGAELYTAIKRQMPSSTIILEPQLISTSTDGHLILIPLLGQPLPADIVLDFTSADPEKFPFLVTVFSYEIRTPSLLSPGNCGILLSMKHENYTPKPTNNCTNGITIDNSPNLWYLGANETLPQSTLRTVETLPLRSDATVLYPTVIQTTASGFGAPASDYVKNSRPKTPAQVQTMMLHSHLLNFASIVSSAPALLDTHIDRNLFLSDYVEKFDKQLANALAKKETLDNKQSANVNLIKKLLSAELQARAKRDQKTVSWILAGKFGESFRAARDQGHKGFNNMMASSWLSAGLLTAANPAPSAANPGNYLSYEMNMISAHMVNVDTANKSFYDSLVPTIESLENESIEFEGQKIKVDMTNQKSLNSALFKLYAAHKQ